MLCWLCLPVSEATDGGFKNFAGVKMNVSGLEGLACWLSTMKEVGCPLDCCCCPLLVLLSGLEDLALRHLCLWDG